MSALVCPQCSNECDEAHRFCPVCGFPVAELSRQSDDPLVGTTLPGGYVILELVGVGGMGRVYRAEQKALGRTVAVKIIHPHLLGDESASVRFITEARATSRLNHPNSVAVIDFGKNDGQLYLVMEFLRGRDLARVVYDEGPLPFRRIIDVMIQVLAALAEAHHLGIIHRDLKPENIVLEPMRSGGDFVKVVDFGLAKMKQEVQTTSITSPGIVCGTPDYMAPEQGRGDPIDARSDLYACGVILFQLLTGRLPFEAESPTQVVLMHLSIPPPNPSAVAPERDIPEPLIEICLTALEKDAARRFQTADEFAMALRELQSLLDAQAGRLSLTGEQPSNRFAWGDLGAAPCGSCGAPVPKGQKFCGDCGARVGGSPPSRRADGGAARTRERVSSIPRLPLPFTAREEDLDWLEASRFEVGSSVEAVRIVGDHGVGKSRLLHEFLSDAAAKGDMIVETGPDPWWAEVGYYALRKAIVGLARLPPDGGLPSDWTAATPEARHGLAEIFGKGDSSGDSVRPSKPHVGLSPDDRRFIAAEALRWAILRTHRGQTKSRVILAVDDLMAVDGASRNALSDVIAEPPLAPMLIVATHAAGFDPKWGGSTLRELRGLPTHVAASLVKGIPTTRGDSATGTRTVPPLYIDQLVRFNMEGGSDPPTRIADLIALRIERLPPDARRTLQALSVIGDAANLETLGRLLPEIRSFDALIGLLSAAGMVEDRGSSGGSSLLRTIRSTHPLIRDVTLATIPAAVRRDLHAKAMEDDIALLLPLEAQALHAYHAQSAFEALMQLEQVADRTASRGDLAGSVMSLRRGLDLARREIFRGELEDPVRAVLIFSRKLGESLAMAGDLTDADGVLREALDLAGPSGADRALVLSTLAAVARERDRASEATGYLREALDLAKQAAANDLVNSLERMRRDWLER